MARPAVVLTSEDESLFVSPVGAPSSRIATQMTRHVGSVTPVQPVGLVAPDGQHIGVFEQKREGQPAAVLELSDEARAMARNLFSSSRERGSSTGDAPSSTGDSGLGPSEGEELTLGRERSSEAQGAQPDTEVEGELSEEEKQQIQELEQRDREVRVHEQAHKSVGGQYAGAIHYDYQRGPDGQNYAIGGHVNIDVSPIQNDPSATLAKMQQVVRAALAPAEPSPADRSVAAQASGQAAQARQELAEETAAQLEGGSDERLSSGNLSFDALLRGASGSDPAGAERDSTFGHAA